MEFVKSSNICRYFNAGGGCWHGNGCRFLHIPDKRPICRFFISENGCRFGANCHFRHSNIDGSLTVETTTVTKINTDRNNNNMLFNLCSKAIQQQTLDKCEDRETDEKPESKPSPASVTVSCSSCKWTETTDEESSKRILREHYLSNFLIKDSQHIKSIKRLSFLPSGHVYWCKVCCISFERSWSLFQHIADKSRPNKDGKINANIHKGTLENISGLLSGFDLGLISLAKLQVDTSSLITNNMMDMMNSFIRESFINIASFNKLKNFSSLMKMPRESRSSKYEELDYKTEDLVYHSFSNLDVGPRDPETYVALDIINGYEDL